MKLVLSKKKQLPQQARQSLPSHAPYNSPHSPRTVTTRDFFAAVSSQRKNTRHYNQARKGGVWNITFCLYIVRFPRVEISGAKHARVEMVSFCKISRAYEKQAFSVFFVLRKLWKIEKKTILHRSIKTSTYFFRQHCSLNAKSDNSFLRLHEWNQIMASVKRT